MSHRHGTLVEWAIDWMSGIDPYAGPRKTQTFEPVPTGYDGSTAQSRRLLVAPVDETRLSIDPYPFDVRPSRVCYAYKHVAGDFPSETAFLEAYCAAVPKPKYFEFV